MARNLVKEAAWQKEKYDQFKFQIDKELGTAFREHLKEKNIKVTDWFRAVINETLQVPVDNDIQVPVDNNIQVPVSIKETDVLDLEPVKSIVDTSTSIQVPVQKNKHKKARSNTPTPEIIDEWVKLRKDGLSFDKIAPMYGVYKGTVNKYVTNVLKNEK